jgi:hypothetical protein
MYSIAMTDRLPVNGQVIGEAERSLRPLMERVLDETGTTFSTWVALNSIAAGGGTAPEAELGRFLGQALDEPGPELLDRLRTGGLVETAAGDVILTPAGRALHGRVREAVGAVTARLVAGLDPDDLVTTRRVLEEMTRRARAEREREAAPAV